jgi:hypothetical protein
MALVLNEDASGVIRGVGDQKLQLVVESEHRDELDSAEARRFALEKAGHFGFGNAGLSEMPSIEAVGTDGAAILDLDPGREIVCFRTTFTLNKRI